MNVFYKDGVAIIRRKGNEYVREDIMTNTVLSRTGISAKANRANVINRLRQDPSVFMVLEDKEGICSETACHSSGFCFHVILRERDIPSASLRVSFNDTLVHEESFSYREGEGNEPEFLDDVCNSVIKILSCIIDEDYGFVNNSCPFLRRMVSGTPIGLGEAGHLLEREGYQTERISTIAWVAEPFLFVHENEVILLGSRHFDGETLYLEMKRFFSGVNKDVVDTAIKKVASGNPCISVICWDDGSWSFRIDMDDDVCEKNFIEKLLTNLSELKSFVNLIEDQDGVGCEPWSITAQQRHLFIYETLDMSKKLARLNI